MSATAKVYEDGDKLVKPTGESPDAFKGVMFVVLEGTSPDNVVEGVRTADQLKKLTPVNPKILTPEWCKALGLPIAKKEVKQRGEAVVEVVETRYVKMNPGIAKASVPFFMGLLLFMVLSSMPFNGPFAALCIGGGLYAVLYQCAITHKAGAVEHERV